MTQGSAHRRRTMLFPFVVALMTVVGSQSSPRATAAPDKKPTDAFNTLPGFEVQLLYKVAAEQRHRVAWDEVLSFIHIFSPRRGLLIIAQRFIAG